MAVLTLKKRNLPALVGSIKRMGIMVGLPALYSIRTCSYLSSVMVVSKDVS
jgi:hypothetical protein